MKLVTLFLALLISTSIFADISWKPYTEDALKMAQKSGKKIVLGFHKKGCGTCHAQDKALQQAGIENKKNVEFLVVQRKNSDHTKVYERFGFSSRQWAAIILMDGNKEVARINPGTTKGSEITNLVKKI